MTSSGLPVSGSTDAPCDECGMVHAPGGNSMCSVGYEVDHAAVIERLAVWIEHNVEGAQVFRHNGIVVT